MKKYFLIKSIRRDEQPIAEDGTIRYTITPVSAYLQSFGKLGDKSISLEVYGVKGRETAVIIVSGPRASVKYFPTTLADTNFYEHFSLREVTCPECYV